MNKVNQLVSVSIVSHGHGQLLPGLLEDLLACPEVAEIIFTLNIPESDIDFEITEKLILKANASPKGFGENHNAAFQIANYPFFAVINPDIRLKGNPFPDLMESMMDSDVAIVAPAVVNPQGDLEDSARQFPTIQGLASKAIGRNDGRLHYALGDSPFAVPWVAGMFMLFHSEYYADISGFDEKYFLYYEDVDICARTWKAGYWVMLSPSVQVIHDAQRTSRRNLQHMRWHAASMFRYLRKYYSSSFPREIGC